VLNTNSSKISSAVAQIKEFSKITSADSIIVAYSLGDSVSEDFFVVKGKETVNENYLGKDFSYSVQGFFQANHEVAEKMHEYCRKLFQKYDTGNAMLIDLYGGVGTFGIINSDLFRKVFVVEKFKPSAELAKINIEMNGANNAEVLCADARHIARLDFSGPVFVIADPPRSGMDQKTIEILNKILPDVIIYVSCNPAQLGKDIKKFRKYAIKSAALFDMFPQTSHFEAVVELVRE
jgi:23S rRNA (uracil1939-C5)-methyltransferase